MQVSRATAYVHFSLLTLTAAIIHDLCSKQASDKCDSDAGPLVHRHVVSYVAVRAPTTHTCGGCSWP